MARYSIDLEESVVGGAWLGVGFRLEAADWLVEELSRAPLRPSYGPEHGARPPSPRSWHAHTHVVVGGRLQRHRWFDPTDQIWCAELADFAVAVDALRPRLSLITSAEWTGRVSVEDAERRLAELVDGLPPLADAETSSDDVGNKPPKPWWRFW